jgi:Ca2+:H+ antiporter
VLGFSLLFGGHGELDRWSSFLSFGAIAVATLFFLIPAIPGWDGDPDRRSLAELSVPVSIAVLFGYVIVTVISLRRHRLLHVASGEDVQAWSLRSSLIVLGVATVVTAFTAEVLVGAIHTFSEETGLTDFFTAAVIVAIVGNAAEHGGAVVVAARGRIKLAAEIALASAAQVAVFLIPAVALLSWLIEPLALSFRVVEIGALAGSLAFTTLVLFGGRSSHLRGALLIVGYLGVAAAFFAVGERS